MIDLTRQPPFQMTILRLMTVIAVAAVCLALGRVTFLLAVPALWYGGYSYATRSPYGDDIGVWVAALYPILAALSLSSIWLGAALFNDNFVLNWFSLPCICLGVFTSVVLAVGVLADLASIPLLIQMELQQPERGRAVSTSQLFALLVVAPSCWLGVVFFLIRHKF